MADPRVRQLTIKNGIVKRLTKEKIVYEKEVVQQEKRIERLKGEGKDENTLRKEDEVLHESMMMVPDTQRRLAKALTELKEFVDSEKDMSTTKEYELALTIIQEANAQLA